MAVLDAPPTAEQFGLLRFEFIFGQYAGAAEPAQLFQLPQTGASLHSCLILDLTALVLPVTAG
ncbi:hypothetical protein, partial [Arthrobacter sp. H14]|uniref:hypothetical protein n=1 Tax=Arthrobacter sp. H14 TaxID=1312959 RepID=UPI000564B8AE